MDPENVLWRKVIVISIAILVVALVLAALFVFVVLPWLNSPREEAATKNEPAHQTPAQLDAIAATSSTQVAPIDPAALDKAFVQSSSTQQKPSSSGYVAPASPSKIKDLDSIQAKPQ